MERVFSFMGAQSLLEEKEEEEMKNEGGHRWLSEAATSVTSAGSEPGQQEDAEPNHCQVLDAWVNICCKAFLYQLGISWNF